MAIKEKKKKKEETDYGQEKYLLVLKEQNDFNKFDNQP